ncbi:MAG TPA: tetratricopeptide repeat protein, partial [Actinoplanes sp.]
TVDSTAHAGAVSTPGGRSRQCADVLGDSLTDRERILGDDHPDTMQSRGNLAIAYRAAGRTDEAIALHTRTLTLTLTDMERILGDDHPDTLRSRNNLANAHQQSGQPDNAQALRDKPR